MLATNAAGATVTGAQNPITSEPPEEVLAASTPEALLATTCVAVIAAGAARRMGSPKQLLEMGREPLVRRVCRTALGMGAAETVLVTGCHADEVAPCVADLPLDVLRNGLWERGQATSVRLAAQFAAAADCRWLCVVPGDMPFVSPAHLRALAARAACGGVSAVPSRSPEGTPMAPCLFERRHYARLSSLTGDAGALKILRDPAFGCEFADVAFPDATQAFDVDTPDDYRRALDLLG